jgi:hypothetical protein
LLLVLIPYFPCSEDVWLNWVVSQGSVFERVIQEVCDASQVDFEESGVDQQTLADLRNVSVFPSFFRFDEMSLFVEGEPLDG